MTHIDAYTISEEIVNKLGLKLTDEKINAQIAPESRVFAYPELAGVYVMESDLYGNVMNEGSCFLAFYGHHGLMGKELRVSTLENSSVAEIEAMVEKNRQG